MTSTPAPPLVDPGPPPSAPPGAPRGSDRFFLWVGGLGVARADGWLGGVCAGIAARLRIDPLIVRGVLLVVALFGFPVLIAYAVAWALLPDIDGRIHLQDLLRGRFEPAIVGIGILAFLSLFPLLPWTFPTLSLFGFVPEVWNWGPLGALVIVTGIALVAGLVVLIVRAARASNHPGAPVPDPRTASADPGGDPGIPAATADSGDAAPAGGPGPDAEESVDETPSASGPAQGDLSPATPDDVAAWRAHHGAWKIQDAAWRRQQQDADRAAREQARRERQAAGAVFAAEADERRRVRRATKPRTSAAFVATVVGLALVAGAITSLAVAAPGVEAGFAAAAGVFVAALVVALAMVVAGIARRRSGFLAFVAVALLIGGAATTAVSSLQDFALGSAYVNNLSGPVRLTQPFGTLSIELVESPATNPIRITKRSGDTYVTVGPEVELVLSAKLGDGDVNWTRVDPRNGEELSSGVWRGVESSDGTARVQRRVVPQGGHSRTVQPLTIDQASGRIFITMYVFDTEETP